MFGATEIPSENFNEINERINKSATASNRVKEFLVEKCITSSTSTCTLECVRHNVCKHLKFHNQQDRTTNKTSAETSSRSHTICTLNADAVIIMSMLTQAGSRGTRKEI